MSHCSARPERTSVRRAILLSYQFALIVLAGHGVAGGDEVTAPSPRTQHGPLIVLRSPRFVLHTDLLQHEAEQTLSRMEAALKVAAGYWRCESRRQIECYVVKDQAKWPDSALPHPLARVWVGGIGGATISQFENVCGRARIKATVYAHATPGIAEHEVIHAYCYHAFGEAGPDWYKEGMAQAITQRAVAHPHLGCSPELVRTMSSEDPGKVSEIVQAGRFTNDLSVSFGLMLSDHKLLGNVPLSDWTPSDDDSLQQVKQHYLRSWTLCHMLLHNPNYATRFRMLGESYLSNGRGSFQDAFAAVSDEIDFEYAFFVRHMDVGYRVDLCRWDWHERFRTLDQQRVISRRIQASRGFQASGLEVSAGRRYGFATEGAWATSANGAMHDADGDATGKGTIVGTVERDFQLSEPFQIGSDGSFVAPASGKLFLRCHDAWNELADNRGEILVRFTR